MKSPQKSDTDRKSWTARRKEKRCVVHFFHRDFRRCKIMDGHLEVNLSCLSLLGLTLRASVTLTPVHPFVTETGSKASRYSLSQGRRRQYAVPRHQTGDQNAPLRDRVRRRNNQDEVSRTCLRSLDVLYRLLTRVCVCRIVGFDELPGGDNFATATLEQGMQECGRSLFRWYTSTLLVSC